MSYESEFVHAGTGVKVRVDTESVVDLIRVLSDMDGAVLAHDAFLAWLENINAVPRSFLSMLCLQDAVAGRVLPADLILKVLELFEPIVGHPVTFIEGVDQALADLNAWLDEAAGEKDARLAIQIMDGDELRTVHVTPELLQMLGITPVGP